VRLDGSAWRGWGRRHFAAAFLAAILLAACGRGEGWHVKDISGLMPDLAFALTDDQGETVHAANYRGHVVLLYFGYTHCPDVCPATLARLSAALKQAGSGGAQMRVLFVTVDPARDTLEVMRDYTRYFGPQFLGLRGTDAELAALTKRYRVTYGRGKPDAHGGYEVSHSSAVFVFDREGHVRLIIRDGDGVPAIAADLKRLAGVA
jgi:protein SCO1/2